LLKIGKPVYDFLGFCVGKKQTNLALYLLLKFKLAIVPGGFIGYHYRP
jgi:hypothetical protein